MIAQLPAAPSSSPVVFSTDQVRVAVASALDRIAERGWDIARDTPMAPSFQRSDVTEVCVLTCPDHDPDGEPTGDTFTLYWFRTADGTWWDETFAPTQLHPQADPRNVDASLSIHPVHTEPSAWLDVETYAAICAMGQPPRDPEAGPPPGPTSVITTVGATTSSICTTTSSMPSPSVVIIRPRTSTRSCGANSSSTITAEPHAGPVG